MRMISIVGAILALAFAMTFSAFAAEPKATPSTTAAAKATVHTPYGVDFALSSDWKGGCDYPAAEKGIFLGCLWDNDRAQATLSLSVRAGPKAIRIEPLAVDILTKARAAATWGGVRKEEWWHDPFNDPALSSRTGKAALLSGRLVQTVVYPYNYKFVDATKRSWTGNWNLTFLPGRKEVVGKTWRKTWSFVVVISTRDRAGDTELAALLP